MLQWDGVIGLAEVMNVPGVLNGNETSLGKLLAAQKGVIPLMDTHLSFQEKI